MNGWLTLSRKISEKSMTRIHRKQANIVIPCSSIKNVHRGYNFDKSNSTLCHTVPNMKNSSSQERNDIFSQNSQIQSVDAEEMNINRLSQRKGRGMTTGISVERKRRGVGRLDVVIHPRRNRIVGENAKYFKTEAGVILKQHVPLQYAQWKDIPSDIKRKLWLGLKQKFNLEDEHQVRKVVYGQLNRQYRSYRSKLHTQYVQDKQRPVGVSAGDWELLIKYFESDAYKKISDRNKHNRQMLKMSHTCGIKSIAQSCYEDRDPETGEEPTRTSTWKKMRYSNKKKEWVDEPSKEAYDKILELQDGDGAISEDEAFVEVLGQEKPHRLRGCGDGLKPPSAKRERINAELQKENENLRKELEQDKESMEALKTENKEMALRLKSLEAKIPEIFQALNQISHVPYSNV